MSTSSQVLESPVLSSLVPDLSTDLLPSRAVSSSSSDMDEEGGASLEEIMGFGSFNGTKRQPKHDGKGQSGRATGPISTGANSQPVAARQPTSTNGPPASHGAESSTTSQTMPDTVNRFGSTSVGSVAHLPRRLPLNEDVTAQGQPEYQAANLLAPPGELNTTISTQQTNTSSRSSPANIQQSTRRDITTQAARINSSRDRDPEAIGYRHSTTGISMTNAELNEYARGKVETMIDVNGKEYETKVYFQPSFLEDPWAGL